MQEKVDVLKIIFCCLAPRKLTMKNSLIPFLIPQVIIVFHQAELRSLGRQNAIPVRPSPRVTPPSRLEKLITYNFCYTWSRTCDPYDPRYHRITRVQRWLIAWWRSHVTPPSQLILHGRACAGARNARSQLTRRQTFEGIRFEMLGCKATRKG